MTTFVGDENVFVTPQPDDVTCGPSCLHSLYCYYNDPLPLEQIIEEVVSLPHGGTLAVYLACHALKRGYEAQIYTYNLQLFDPSWFKERKSQGAGSDLAQLLESQLQRKRDRKDSSMFAEATQAYLEFLQMGGAVTFQDLTPSLLVRLLKYQGPILTGLSSTYLYESSRELVKPDGSTTYDSIAGEPAGHFVLVSAVDGKRNCVNVADPYHDNPNFGKSNYQVDIHRLMNSVLLGILTYDANLLMIRPSSSKQTSVEHRCRDA